MQAISSLEDFFNRYTVAVSYIMVPKEILAFVMGNVKPCTSNDLEISMTWIDLKKKYEVSLNTFSHEKLEPLLQKLIVQMKIRRTSVHVDTALGISTQQHPPSSAKNIEVDANGAMAPPLLLRQSNKCLHCGSEAHLVKTCTRASKRRDAKSFYPEEASNDQVEDEQPKMRMQTRMKTTSTTWMSRMMVIQS
eukprot:2500242-Amphidinium_carterae.1